MTNKPSISGGAISQHRTAPVSALAIWDYVCDKEAVKFLQDAERHILFFLLSFYSQIKVLWSFWLVNLFVS